jgi:hypothetical protein
MALAVRFLLAPVLALWLVGLVGPWPLGRALAGGGTVPAPVSPPEGVPGEVPLASAADVRALCAELRDDGEAAQAIYVVAVPSTGFSFSSYDKKRARLAVDVSKGLRHAAGQWELEATSASGVELAVPVAPKEAARLVKEASAGRLLLWLWFRPARLAAQSLHCVGVRSVKGESLRLGVEPMAFALARPGGPSGGAVVAAGATAAFQALRDQSRAEVVARVDVGVVVRTDERGNAPDDVTRSARALAPELIVCYEQGLAKEPTLRGAVVLGLEIDVGGKVSSARAELDGLGAPEVTACVLGRVKSLRMPASRAGRYSVPLRFGESSD